MESVSSAQIGVFIGCLVFLLGLAVMIKSLLTREPPLHREYASRESHQQLEQRVDGIEDEIRGGFARLDEKRSKSVAGIYDEIREMNTRLAQTSEKANLTYAHLQSIDVKMDQVLQKLPR